MDRWRVPARRGIALPPLRTATRSVGTAACLIRVSASVPVPVAASAKSPLQWFAGRRAVPDNVVLRQIDCLLSRGTVSA